jgi:peptidoglycan/LPS O-acetylase OafA/YrhL
MAARGGSRAQKGISSLRRAVLGDKNAAGMRIPSGSRALETGRTSGLGYLPALDGLRALAVGAVLLYHADLGSFTGGFLGVDVFFVLSGYLITCVLLDNRRTTGRIGLGRFYLRRARRLLPALLVMLAVVCVYVVVFLPDEAAKLRDDILSALAYVMNWHLIYQDQPYFDTIGRAPFLRHLWSLAVEEQFYLLWPLLLGGGLVVFRQHRERLAIAILALAGVSALLMAVLYEQGGDPSRVYYGTDTHASGLLIGAALAILWPPWRLSTKTGPVAPAVLDLAGIVGLAVLVSCFLSVSEFDTALYRGGYFAFTIVAAVVIAAVVHPATRFSSSVLALAPLRWIGQRSYGIYLWHWPVYLVTRPGLDVPLSGFPLLVLRVGITVGIAAASYRFIELPIRAGALGRSLAALRRNVRRDGQRFTKRLGVAGAGVASSVVLLGIGLAVAESPGPPSGFPSRAAHIPITTTTAPTATTAPATTSAPTTLPALGGRVTAVGDSVMLGAQGALQQFLGDRLQMDANVSRHAREAIDVIRTLRDAGQLGDEFVLHLGTNGPVTDGEFDEIMQLLSGVKRVVVVNIKVDRAWEQQVNDTLAAGVPRYSNAVLFDWHAAGSAHPEYFVSDGVHLTRDGAGYYALVITSKL